MSSTPPKGRDNVAIRIFTVDETSGSPAPGVILRVFVSFDAGEDRELTMVVSDEHGFASSKIDLSPYPGVSALKVTYAGGSPAFTVSAADLRNGLDLFRIAPSSADASARAASGIPSVADPDARDALLSPGSIGLIPQLNGLRSLCSQLMPTPMAVRRFTAFQVKADVCKVNTIACPPDRKFKIVLGQILEYEVAWHPLGTSIGHLLNSITLAPCEQVTVAVSDWMRSETASRQESSLTQQETTEHTDHDRLIMESLNSDVTSKSLTAAFASSTGASTKIKMINLTASAGGGISGSLSNTQVAATTTNHLVERIDQAATLVMSHRSSVVFRANADERRTFQTQTLRNNNKCHTMTFLYFQVNQSFRVVTSYKGVRDAVLVQYPNDDFDAKRAYCNAVVLRPALLDKSLDKCFDDLAEALFCCAEKPAGPDVRMDSITITVTVQSNLNVTSLTLGLGTANGPIVLPAFSTIGWQSGQTHSQTIPLQAPIDPTIVHTVFISLGGFFGSHTLFLSQLQLTYHAVGVTNSLSLYSTQIPFGLSQERQFDVKAEIPPVVGADNPCVSKSCGAQKLLAHLNCEKRFYNNLIWLNEDPNERVMRWSCCSGLDLIGAIENTPIAIYGDFLVFPASPLVHDVDIPQIGKLVILPTPGVYSEGILGQCNTCEIVDPQRYTDWTCPVIPPDPTFPNPQTGVTPIDLKPDAITNQITLSSVPTAPDSVLKTLLDTLLTSAKNDTESQALLEKLFDLLKDTLTQAATKPSSGGGGD